MTNRFRQGHPATWATLVLAGILAAFAPTASAQFEGLDGDSESILTALTFVSADGAIPGDTIWLAVRLDIMPGWHVNSARPLQDYLIPTELTLDPPDGWQAGRVVYPEGSTIPLLGEPMSVYSSGAVVFTAVVAPAGGSPGPANITGRLSYQGCDENSCVAPADVPLSWNVNVTLEPGKPRNADLFAPLLGGSAAIAPPVERAAPDEDSELARLIREHGAWGYLLAFLLAFGTGFLLSFSPCTYPMVPITVSIFAGQARGPGRGFFLSVVYVLTMAVLYGIMGTVVASVGGVFGAWLAHPIVVGVIVAVFILFALSMFGLYDLQVPERWRSRMAGRGGEGVGGAIVLGAVAALVVSPCVGPFVAGIMLYVATTGSPILGFLILFTFALGLGTLFILIGTFSSAINALPHAGMWMESVKKFFGFVLLLMALYFARTLISDALTGLLAGLLFLGAGVFGGGLDRLTGESGFFPRLRKLFGILCVILGVYFLGGYLVFSGVLWPPLDTVVGLTSAQDEMIPWEGDLDAALARAQREGRPVLIDTWATWCANCRRLDRTTWAHDAVAAEAERFVPLKLQLETGDAPLTRRFMEMFGLRQYSLPTIILIDRNGDSEIIRGYVGPEDMLRRMQAIR